MSVRAEPAPTPTVGRTDVAALAAGLVTVTVWGSAFVGIRAAGDELSPGALALGRLLVCSAVLGAAALVRREPLPLRRDFLAHCDVRRALARALQRRPQRGRTARGRGDGGDARRNGADPHRRARQGSSSGEGFPPGLFAGLAVAFGGTVLIGIAVRAVRLACRPGCGTAAWSRRSPGRSPSSSKSPCWHGSRRCR